MNTAAQALLQAIALVVIGGAVGLAANGLREDRLSVTKDYFPVRADVRDRELKPGKPKHELQVATLEDAVNAFNDPNHRPGESDSKVFFIDAREDLHFKEGHVPGALQVDHYRLEKYLPEVLDMLGSAEKILVYCNGGNCEDSILVSHDLLDAKVPYEKIFLFEGGMDAWREAKQPLE